MTSSVDATRAAVDARIARARTLAATHPATAELLTFYARLAGLQRSLLSHASTAARVPTDAATPFVARLDTSAIASHVPDVLDWLAREAPPALRAATRALVADSAETWRERIEAWLRAGDAVCDDGPSSFVSETVTQPFAEVAARAMTPGPALVSTRSGEPATCSCCGGLPVAGVLRERGHGAGRALVCGRCLTEWPVPRMMCPACGGLEVAALPVFRADQWPAVRLDACDTCHAYLKSVDLTVDGQAIAVVDDLATLPLDLWAAEQGFRKRRPNLLRL